MRKYTVISSHRFKKKFKLCKKRGYDIDLIDKAIEILGETGTLPPEYKPHQLHGNYDGIWECHIKSDWLMIWQQDDYELTLLLLNTGTHSDIF